MTERLAPMTLNLSAWDELFPKVMQVPNGSIPPRNLAMPRCGGDKQLTNLRRDETHWFKRYESTCRPGTGGTSSSRVSGRNVARLEPVDHFADRRRCV